MRDFRDAKAMAETIRAALAAKGHKISIGESLELIAKAFGAADWNTLSALIKQAGDKPAEKSTETPSADALENLAKALGAPDWATLLARVQESAAKPQRPERPPRPPEPASAPKRRSRGVHFSTTLEATLYRAVAAATQRRHAYTTLEHLLLALLDDTDAFDTLEACGAPLEALRAEVTRYLDEELGSLVAAEPQDPVPTAGFHRVIQRTVIHAQSSGRREATGANVLVAIFSEQESHAAYNLQRQGVDRFDCVNFIAHGVRKDGRAA
jgi:hypothetical protein